MDELEGARKALRVLYVDDERALVSLANQEFLRLGHSFYGFSDPNLALEAFRAHPQDYDLVMTDLSMPQVSGFDLAREVLALRRKIPVLVISGYISAVDEQHAHEIGIRELLPKPLTLKVLGHVLDRLFRIDEQDANLPE